MYNKSEWRAVLEAGDVADCLTLCQPGAICQLENNWLHLELLFAIRPVPHRALRELL